MEMEGEKREMEGEREGEKRDMERRREIGRAHV